VLTTVLVTVALTACSPDDGGDDGGSRAADGAPNIVVFYLDDLDVALLEDNLDVLPEIRDSVVERGTRFSNAFVVDSVCCPSRATMLRGQYDHNTGMRGNVAPHGGFERFRSQGHERSTLATWLRDAGYTTGLFGKYLNGYPDGVEPDYVPPGWDSWVSVSRGNAHAGFDYTLNVDGELERHGDAPDDYLVDVLADHASEFIRSNAGEEPFFALVSLYVPHLPAVGPPRYDDEHTDAIAPRTPSFGEEDVSDKPTFVRAQPPLDDATIALLDSVYRRQLRTMRATDDLVGDVLAALDESGELDDTYVVFTSDNGFHRGQHRLRAGKLTAYDEDIRVPLIVRGPGVPEGRTVDRIVLNTDLAPTFADLAGAEVPDFVDGRSFAPLLGTGEAPAGWRTAFLVERYDDDVTAALGAQAADSGGTSTPAATTAPGAPPANPDMPEMLPDDIDDAPLPSDITLSLTPGYFALRSERHLYVEWNSGDLELYDMRADPAQLDNIAASAPPALKSSLAGRLAELKECAATTCRAAEDRPLAE
jgi:arylsulfatase A-like enzyme